MLVKIHDINSEDKIDRKDAFKAPNGYYYSSEAAYKKAVAHEEMRKKCIDYMYDLMGYQSFMKMPTIFFKKLKEWAPYGYNIVYMAMTIAETSLNQTLQIKNFSNEYNKVMYISAVIENKLNDALKIEERNATIVNDMPNIIIDDLNEVGRKSKVVTSVSDLLGGM